MVVEVPNAMDATSTADSVSKAPQNAGLDESNSESRASFYCNQLKAMVTKIPKKYQKKISEELCTQLANCLLNEINFEIVKGLTDIQHVTEKYLYHLRLKVVNKQQSETLKLLETTPLTDHERVKDLMELKHKKQLTEVDMKLVRQLDQKVAEQQETLQKAGFPGFYATTNSNEIKVQMFLLDFILRLSKMDAPSI